VPTYNAVAGDAIPVKLKVNDSSAGIPGVWDVDESNAGSLVLLRRTLFKFKGVTDRMNFINEPYSRGEGLSPTPCAVAKRAGEMAKRPEDVIQGDFDVARHFRELADLASTLDLAGGPGGNRNRHRGSARLPKPI
jgi:hypothetical protein